jgi:hypothetical protein
MVVLGSACAGSIRFCVEVCHVDEPSCELVGPVDSPFTRDQRSEVDVLGVTLCGELEPEQVEVLLDGEPVDEVTIIRANDSNGTSCVELDWDRNLENGLYGVIVEPGVPDQPVTVTVAVDEAIVSERELVLAGPTEVVSLLVDRLQKNEACGT